MRRISTLVVLLATSAACGGGAASQKAAEAPAAPAEARPEGALAPLASLIGDWKRADGSEVHYGFAGDAIFGVAFGKDGFEVSIVTAEPALRTRVIANGTTLTSTDAAPSAEGLVQVPVAREPALEKAEREFAEATAARGVAGWVDWFDEKGAEWNDGADSPAAMRVEGHAAIREFMTPPLSRPGFKLEWRPLTSGLSPDGALGFTIGSWEGVMYEGGERHVRSTGGFVTVWKKQAGGSWKVLFDTGDPVGGGKSEAPAAPAAPEASPAPAPTP